MRRRFFLSLLIFSSGFSLALTSTNGLAQSNDDKTAELASQIIEEVIVTGTRLPRSAILSPTPVVRLDSEDILRSGASNIGELLNEIPALGNTFSLGNRSTPSSAFFSPGSSGLNLLDLRTLGTSRTLVLVNGRRRVASAPGTTAVDVNTVPIDWVDRVEVITGGAAAIYGADAVTGAVNFILKDKIEETIVRAQVTKAGDNPYQTSLFSISSGIPFAENKGNIAAGFEWVKQEGMVAESRDATGTQYFLVDNPLDTDTLGNHDGIPDQILLANARFSFFDKNGVFSTPAGSRYIFNPDGSFRLQNLGTTFQGAFCGDCDGFNFVELFDLQPDFRRFSFHIHGTYDITPDHQLFLDANYTDSESEFLQQGAANFTNPLFISRDNAYISPLLGALMDSNGMTSLSVSRHNVDSGRLGEDNTRKTPAIVFGLKGNINNQFRYDTAVSWGQTKVKAVKTNDRIESRWAAATDAVVDPSSGEIVCRIAIDPTATLPGTSTPVPIIARDGCIPTSVFGHGAVSADAANWFNVDTSIDSTIEQLVVSGDISTDSLFSLPAGGVGFVVGAEYREEKSSSTPDQLLIDGVTFLSSAQKQRGEYHVSELFTEVSLPLLRDVPLIRDLDIDAAVRYSHYDTIGNTVTWKTGLNWAISDMFRVRTTRSKAVRAPNISELFSVVQSAHFNVKDPCSIDTLPDAPNVAKRLKNCAALGVPAGFDSLTDNSSIVGSSSGNSELSEETADTFTLGLIFRPNIGRWGWGDELAVSIDFWRIEIEDVIENISPTNIVNQCVDSASGVGNDLCKLVTRDPISSEIVDIQQVTQNLQAIDTEGYDAEIFYSSSVGPGQFNLRLLATKLLKSDVFPFQATSEDVIDEVGIGSKPEWSATLNASYAWAHWLVAYESRYVDETLRVSNEILKANPDSQSPLTTDSIIYHDFFVRYEMDSGLALKMGVHNATDEDPPKGVDRLSLGNRGPFDLIGRQVFFGASYTF